MNGAPPPGDDAADRVTTDADTQPPVTRYDRTSRIVFVVILAAVVVPMVWLVITATISRAGDGPPSTDRPALEVLDD